MENPTNQEKMNIKVSLAEPDEAKSIQEVFYKTWVATYPNEEFEITVEDIEDKFKDALSEERINKRIESIKNPPEGQTLFVAKEGNNVVGVCRAEKSEQGNRLRLIYVAPEFQGKGVGTLLWNEAKTVFDMSKDTFVDVVTYNTNAIKFYEKLGFEDTGKRFSDDRFTMKNGAKMPEMEMVIRGTQKI